MLKGEKISSTVQYEYIAFVLPKRGQYGTVQILKESLKLLNVLQKIYKILKKFWKTLKL